MPKNNSQNTNRNNLIRRYLLWCYKTTKESLDRIDRYYTQLDVDQFILEELNKRKKTKTDIGLKQLVLDFESYMDKKKVNVDEKKFLDVASRTLSPEYEYLRLRFSAIEKAINHFLGSKELARVRQLYEEEMSQRILSSRENT